MKKLKKMTNKKEAKRKLSSIMSTAQNFVAGKQSVSSGWGVAFDSDEYLLVYDGNRQESQA